VSWEERSRAPRPNSSAIQDKYGRRPSGHHVVPLHQRETFLVQKLIRGGFGNNNVDPCARVLPFADRVRAQHGVWNFRRHPGFRFRGADDVVILIAPIRRRPSVFASRMKKRLRQGARLIVIDPRRIDLVRTPHVEAAHHLPLLPGTNVAVLTALAM